MIYQTFAPFDNSTSANILKWAQSFGQALYNFGWQQQTGHGEVVASAVSSVWTWTNTPAIPTSATATPRVIVNFRGAWSSGNSYAANDTVTSGGLTWIAITTVASGGSAPSTGTSWQPYNFEIWASNGPMSSALQIFLKIVYGNNTSTFAPAIHVSVGKGIDSSGNITGAVNLHTTTPTTLGMGTAQPANTSSLFEMDFSGDADNFRMCLWRNGVSQGWTGSALGPPVLVIDRAKTATGLDADGFAYVGWLGLPSSSTVNALSAILLKSSVGTIAAQTISPQWAGTVASPAGSIGMWGSSPPMPIMPLVGYTANPLLGAITVQAQDWQNGVIIPVWMYGAPRRFLVCGSDTTLSTYRQVNGTGNSAVPAILWE